MVSEDLEFHVLVYLALGDWRHGYAVHRWIREHHGMEVALQSIYRVIARLHQRGFVELQETSFCNSLAGIPRKNYRLSYAGRCHVEARVEAARVQRDRLTRSLSEYERVTSHDPRETNAG